jgi:hypothetical protein
VRDATPCPDCRVATDRADARLCPVGQKLQREYRAAMSTHWDRAKRAPGTAAEEMARKDVVEAKDRYFAHLNMGWCPEEVAS